MIVSNFELLVKRIANPVIPLPNNVKAVFRRVVQGYFLIISNLEETRTIRLSLKLTITSSINNREINSDNTVCFFDNGNTDNRELQINRSTSSNYTEYKTQFFDLGPKETGIITILPNVTGNTPANPLVSSDMEIRGYAELRQGRFFNGISSIFLGVPQANILTNPEIRGTFLDNAYPSTNESDELDFDQIAYSLPTASGKLSNIVESVPPLIISNGFLNASFDLEVAQKQLMIDNPNYTEKEMMEVSKMLQDLKNDDQILDIAKKLKRK